MTEVSYQSTQGVQYGVSDHVLGLIYIILRDRSKDIPSSIRTQKTTGIQDNLVILINVI